MKRPETITSLNDMINCLTRYTAYDPSNYNHSRDTRTAIEFSNGDLWQCIEYFYTETAKDYQSHTKAIEDMLTFALESRKKDNAALQTTDARQIQHSLFVQTFTRNVLHTISIVDSENEDKIYQSIDTKLKSNYIFAIRRACETVATKNLRDYPCSREQTTSAFTPTIFTPHEGQQRAIAKETKETEKDHATLLDASP